VVMIRRTKTIMSLFGPPNEFLRDNANGKSASQSKSSRKDVAHQRKIFLAFYFFFGGSARKFPPSMYTWLSTDGKSITKTAQSRQERRRVND
jgi:hypothetical protein